MSRQVKHDGRGAFQIRFAFDRRLVELVKTLPNRRWNADERYWSAPEDDVVQLVELLHPEGFRFDRPTLDLYAACGGRLSIATRPAAAGTGSAQRPLFGTAPAGEPTADSGEHTGRGEATDYSVSRLNEQVRAVLEEAFPQPIWLVGEIDGFNKAAHRKHVGFHLVERDAGGRTVSEVGATLFESTRREVELQLAAAGNPFRLEDELLVRMLVRVELHVPWGSYRVIVEQLDVNFTLGEAARRREEIVRRLTEAGLLERNRSLTFPALPLRIGLVTSLGSDAYNDILRTLHESRFAFRLTAHGARVQGRATEPSVLNALEWFRRRADRYDVVLICRGGGSRTDLAWFDSEKLGRAVATFPLPVVIGIGHEQDRSVLDFVGWRSKTPTAAATLLVDTVRGALDAVESLAIAVLDSAGALASRERRLALERARRLFRCSRALAQRERAALVHRQTRMLRGAQLLLDGARVGLARYATTVPRSAALRVARVRAALDAASRQLLQGARRDLAAADRRVRGMAVGLGPVARRQLHWHFERTEARARRLRLGDPRRVVERGFAIVRLPDGSVLQDPVEAPRGTALRAELRRGALRATSDGPASNHGREETR